MSVEVTVGVVTHERSDLFRQMLDRLKVSISSYPNSVIVLVVNNSGPSANKTIADIIDNSGIHSVATVTLIDSPQNNISVGRNLILEHCKTRLLAFIDDDEYPRTDWLTNLVDQYLTGGCELVGGPILPVYPESAPKWVQSIDLHNTVGLKTGDFLPRVATGNCLLDLEATKDHRFDVEFGLTGGGDANFFNGLTSQGLKLAWRADAIVDETITDSRATSRYAIFRFIKQGNNFSRVVLIEASLGERVLFKVRAMGLAVIGIVGGLLSYPFHPTTCARLWKGGFTNLGKVLVLPRGLYG